MELSGTLSRSRGGNVRLDYKNSESSMAVLWEPLPDGIAHTVCNEDGSVIKRDFFECADSAADVDRYVSKFIETEKIAVAMSLTEPKEVALKRNCPACGDSALVLEAAQQTISIPALASSARPLVTVDGKITQGPGIIFRPIYRCKKCDCRGYHFTDKYLSDLVSKNKDKFPRDIWAEITSDMAKALDELRKEMYISFAIEGLRRIR